MGWGEIATVERWLIPSFTQQTFIGHLLCVRSIKMVCASASSKKQTLKRI